VSDALGIRGAQALVDAWVRANGGYWPPLSLLARLSEETGEVAREYNHRFGAKRKKASEREADLANELADVLFIVVCMANEQGIDLEAAFERVLEKARVRDAGRFTPSGGAPG
jgi:NTP pyrophosphatase (non-canonical NTP hydrolase)